jgi:hypothetical protein
MALLQPEGTETDKLGVIGVDHATLTALVLDLTATLADEVLNYAGRLPDRNVPFDAFERSSTIPKRFE